MASEPPIHVGVDEMHPHPRHVGPRWLDLAIALSAIFISAVSLFVAVEHGKTERQLVAANSWPFLRENLSNLASKAPDADVEIGVSNGGVGPAKIRSFQVFYKGRAVSSPLDLLRSCCGLSADRAEERLQLPQGAQYSIVDETVLRPGEANVVWKIERGPSGVVVDRLSDALKDVSFRACYCSILDECWTSDLRTTRVQAVTACPAPRQRFDPNGP